MQGDTASRSPFLKQLFSSHDEGSRHGVDFQGLQFSDYRLTDELPTVYDRLGSISRLASKKPNVKRGEVDPSTLVGAPPKLPAHGADRVRRALVADLRAGLVFDKKLKKGGNKMFKAHYANPLKQGQKKCAKQYEIRRRVERQGPVRSA